MEKYSYFREVYSMMSQFMAAFDDCFVMRVDKDGVPKEKIAVRYINGSKQRALFDIVDKSKNITLPAIAINRKNLKRDSNRVQYKEQRMYRPHVNSKSISKIPMPIPVSCDVDISIISHYKEDIDQIVSNFIPWCNPYFIISWKIPEEFGMDFDDELRTEVTWSGSVDYEEPIEVDKSEKHRIIANTSFTIKGWIFPPYETPEAPIYVVRNDFNAIGTGVDLPYESFTTLSASEYTTDTILVSAYPEFTNCFINGKPYDELSLYSINDQTFTFYGKRFGFDNSWYLSGNQIIPELEYQEINTIKYPTISAYKIPDSFIITVNDNITAISLSSGYLNLSGGDYVFVTSNDAGWAKACGFVVDTYNLMYNQYNIVYDNQNLIYV